MSVLQGNYDDIKREIGRYLGFDRNPDNWTANQAVDVGDVITSGYRMFLRPPPIQGDHASHQWNFARPLTYYTLTAGQTEYQMPQDFGGLVDDLIHFVQSEYHYIPIQHINEAQMRGLRQSDWTSGSWYPRYVSFIAENTTGPDTQAMTMYVWPPPDAAHRIQYRYYVRALPLSSENPVPLGGPEHYETVLAAMMAVAEERIDDARGLKWEAFTERLMSSVHFDRKTQVSNLGYNQDRESRSGDNSIEGYPYSGYGANNHITTYSKFGLP